MKKYNLSKIMKRAWTLVKNAGMTISSGLKKAWEEAKTTVEKVKLIGSEKQIKWAEDIIKDARKTIDKVLNYYDEDEVEEIKAVKMVKTNFEKFVNETNLADEIINKRDAFREELICMAVRDYVDGDDEANLKSDALDPVIFWDTYFAL